MATEGYLALPPMPEDYEPPRPVAHEEYLRLAEMLPGTYEYYAGLMYPRFYPPGSTPGGYPAMAGGTAAHAQLIVALLAALRVHLGNRGPCRVYPSDMKLRTLENEYSPDVACMRCGHSTAHGTRERRHLPPNGQCLCPQCGYTGTRETPIPPSPHARDPTPGSYNAQCPMPM